MKPTIGRIVHFCPNQSPDTGEDLEVFAAMVTGVGFEVDTVADLTVFPPGTDMFTIGAVPFFETPKPGHWTWPPRV